MRGATSALLGLLLAGVAATPAQAETVRSMQWHLDAMKADEMWKTSTGEGITVAVIDSGVSPVPELAGRVLDGKDLLKVKGDEHTDVRNHGTTMAALIAGTGERGNSGSYGLAPGAKILPVRVGEGGGGDAHHGDLAAGIRYAADANARVINVSMGGPGDTADLREAVKYALEKGSLIFASVGNSGDSDNLPKFPAATPGVVGVGAIDRQAKAVKVSQHGPQVDLAAPGGDVIGGCATNSGLCTATGTSPASALASASAALIWSAHPTWTNNQVLRVMLNTAGKPSDGKERSDYIGYGVVRPRVALTDPGDPGPADTYPLPDLAAAEPKPQPDPSKPAAPQADGPADATPIDDGSGGDEPYIALGIGAAVLLGGAVAVVAVRSRRRT
ncbi:type VII secretion-associated serine protease mycosin [Streptomyces sp. NPDC101132]|uniref:type VII secretion-associated serine protease mycosin n=1 Tax=Streptomyces sp. NPDC101132 TaxID=3366110 RepID=UPI00380D6BD9